jgi:hypothetical protein
MWLLIFMILSCVFVSVIALTILLPAFVELRKDKKRLEEQIDNLYKKESR